jgi:hypothetical protein
LFRSKTLLGCVVKEEEEEEAEEEEEEKKNKGGIDQVARFPGLVRVRKATSNKQRDREAVLL